MIDKEHMISEIQKILIAEYRMEHPEATEYSDVEVAMMNPVSSWDIEVYLSMQLANLQKEIMACQQEYWENKDKIADRSTFPEEKNELRNENFSLIRKISDLQNQMQFIRHELGDDRDTPRSR